MHKPITPQNQSYINYQLMINIPKIDISGHNSAGGGKNAINHWFIALVFLSPLQIFHFRSKFQRTIPDLTLNGKEVAENRTSAYRNTTKSLGPSVITVVGALSLLSKGAPVGASVT